MENRNKEKLPCGFVRLTPGVVMPWIIVIPLGVCMTPILIISAIVEYTKEKLDKHS